VVHSGNFPSIAEISAKGDERVGRESRRERGGEERDRPENQQLMMLIRLRRTSIERLSCRKMAEEGKQEQKKRPKKKKKKKRRQSPDASRSFRKFLGPLLSHSSAQKEKKKPMNWIQHHFLGEKISQKKTRFISCIFQTPAAKIGNRGSNASVFTTDRSIPRSFLADLILPVSD
jgi:hypothetical protein